MTRRISSALLVVCALGGWSPAQAQTFRFLTQSLPEASTNAVYTVQLITANAAGPVAFGVSAGEVPPGILLDGETGFLSGRPTDAGEYDVTFTAADGASTITLSLTMKVNASGGGGNAGLTFTTISLPQGRVGVAYNTAVETANGVGPFIFGANDLPPGLSLNGQTGQITGEPAAAGTFHVLLSVTDRGENENKVFTVLGLTVLPRNVSTFQFTKVLLDNGEVGTPYSDTITVSGATGNVTYSASGLPAGVSVDSDTGIISGVPAVAGTFAVVLGAADSNDAITSNLTLRVAPGPTSHFYWDFFGLPLAIVNIAYGRQPPILVTAVNGASVSYSALGLPAGVTFDSVTGELGGTATEAGIFPVTITAADSGSSETLTLSSDFIVLPPGGGDSNSLPANLWVKKQSFTSGSPGRDTWRACYVYNADRRTGNAFDPAVDPFQVTLGSRTITVEPGSFTEVNGRFVFSSQPGVEPVLVITIDPRKQAIKVKSTHDTFTDRVPSVLRNAVTLGGRGFRLDEFFDESGSFAPAIGFRRTAVVCEKAKVSVHAGDAGGDSAQFSLLVADPSFSYESGVTALRFRLLSDGVALIDRTFTALASSRESADAQSGVTVFRLKASKDPAAEETLSKNSFDSRTGKMQLGVQNATLSALTAAEEHVFLELTVGDEVYFTSVTLFAKRAGAYSLVSP
jgi:hypothetical protein